MSPVDVPAFLARIGLRELGPPSVESLIRLHTAYVGSVPYDTVQFQLGRPTPLDQAAVAARIIARRSGGYCYQLNGAFALLLDALGYTVRLHRGGAEHGGDPPSTDGGHLALTVTGLPDGPEDGWFVDAGLGDGLYEPLPLRAGTYRQGPLTFRLRPSEIAPGGWRLDHDPRGSFVGIDFAAGPVTIDDFADQHAVRSTSADSPFVRVCTAQRRDADGVTILRSLTRTRLDETTSSTVIESERDWYAALADDFGLTLPDLSADDRARLWRRVVAQHETFLATRPAGSPAAHP